MGLLGGVSWYADMVVVVRGVRACVESTVYCTPIIRASAVMVTSWHYLSVVVLCSLGVLGLSTLYDLDSHCLFDSIWLRELSGVINITCLRVSISTLSCAPDC